jgi:hypothetical protein
MDRGWTLGAEFRSMIEGDNDEYNESMPSAMIVLVWGLIGLSFYKFYDLKVVHYTKEELDILILKRDSEGNFKEE